MEDTKNGKYLSEVINYEKDIVPYKLIQIYSGVGSGKNYWVQTLAEQGLSILFITSRKITAAVQAQNMGAKEFIDIEQWHRNTIAGKPTGSHQYLVSCTNSGLESYARKKYDPDNPNALIWNFFDLVVLDEAHSVITDATFADSAFQVWRFILQVTKQKGCDCKVILMSGTPEPLEKLILNETREDERFKYLPYYDKCHHVDPKEVVIRQENKTVAAAKEIQKYHKKGQRIIYFTSSIGNILQLIEDLFKLGITENDIGVSFSDEEKKNKFSDYMLEKKEKIETCLKETELLPNDVKIFLTTTKNKEGINIQNTDIKIMFAESSQRAELIQMAGRVRNGLDKLIVMYNLSRNYSNTINKWRRNFAKQSIQHVTDIYSAFIEEYEQPTERQIIADVENDFPYIRFNFFLRKFYYYREREYGEELAVRDREKLEEWIDCWDDVITPGKEYFQEWFPFSVVSLAEKPPTDDKIKKKVIEEYFKEHGNFLERVISKEERDTILKDLNTQLKEQITGYKDMGQLGSLLKKGGYTVKEAGKHGNNQFKILLLTKTNKAQKD